MFRRGLLGLRLSLAAGLTLALVSVPLAFALIGKRTYFAGALPGGAAASDGRYHNHIWNRLGWSGGCSSYCTGGIYELTPTGGKVFAVNGIGDISYGHGGTYYDAPWCWNRDSVTHTVNACQGAW